jgi:hypothetical protein
MGCVTGLFRRFVQGWAIAKILGLLRKRRGSGAG